MNERQARLAVMLADERDAIARNLARLNEADFRPGQGAGMVMAFRDSFRLLAVIRGRAMDQEQGRGGLRLAVPLPIEVFAAVHAAMVKACEDRLAEITIEIRGMGVEP